MPNNRRPRVHLPKRGGVLGDPVVAVCGVKAPKRWSNLLAAVDCGACKKSPLMADAEIKTKNNRSN